ncbi:MAG TPA: MFS transporter [Amycolatopsis sp.]|nr:MFS transporter [Amycolatopsis sp.]
MASTTVGLVLGITYPLFTLLLEAQGVSGTLTGLSGAMTPLGMVAAAPLVPRVTRSIGSGQLTALALAAISLALAALVLTTSPLVWCLIRLGVGACAVVVYSLSETWIAETAAPGRHGRVFAAYTATLCLGFSAGPLLLMAGQPIVLTTAIAAPALAAGAMWRARATAPEVRATGQVPVSALLRRLSVLLVPVVAVSAFDGVSIQFLPAYGEARGLSPAAASLALFAFLAGQVVLSYPVGWLADRIRPWPALRLTLAACTAGAALLPQMLGGGAVGFVLLAVWGGVSFGGYPLVLALLGDGRTEHDLLLVNTAFSMVWGIGGVVGPPYVGAASDLLGNDGPPVALTVMMAGALAVSFAGRSRFRPAAPAAPAKDRAS